MSDNIKVVVKVRPLISREIEDKLYPQWRVVNNTLHQIDQNGKDVSNMFTFDKVYDESTKTANVYNDVAKPIVEAAAAGFNGTIFAYGQTSSGKTYTMTGTDEEPGIIHLSVMNLFETIKNIADRDFLVRVSYVEIYNESLIDLLNTEKKNIKIQDTLQGVRVDATVRVATSPEEVLQFMNEGQANRQTGSTNMNVESSRSHTIFQITIESREQTEGEEVGCLNVSQLNLVDLAGSERSGQTGATGMRFKEGTHINKSLTFLGLVIKQLSEGQNKHVNYRDSKLTRLLQNSLGGNAKTSIICAITPAAVEETISTLQFASRAKAIKNSPEVNVVATDNKMIGSLTKQLSSLKTQLESKRNVEEDNQKLQKQIAVLQRFLSGFGLRGSADMMTGARLKMQQKRRATISTVAIPEEDATPSVPKFCTPSLKYNPALIGNSTDFHPIHSMSNLASVPEEPPRLITPPPREQRINEVIEIDSDDDMPSNIQICSPHHKCFNASKTPPCVLRKVAIEADKNFKDLLELTQREKIYSPDVVELLDKLEQSQSVIATLEKNIEKLNRLSGENVYEIKNLKEKISKTEEEVRSVTSAKLLLESRCTEYDTKLTDWEIMFETLKKKSKTRETELLSRLEEVANVKNVNDIKDVIGTTSDSACSNFEELVKDLKQQLSDRNKFIAELEANLQTQNEKVESLENQTQKIQTALDTCMEQLCKSEDENILHKSTIKTLNTIIENQKLNLNIATNDLQTYNNTIQQLQDELSKKEKLLKLSLNDNEIENLITNEEKIIANNENIHNIIQSLKVALDSKNKEIQTLKLVQNNETVNKDNETELANKQIEITQLQEKVTTLEQQLKQNNLDMTNLLQEKNNLLSSLKEVNKELLELKEKNEMLSNDIQNYENKLSSLNEYNEDLKKEKQHIEKELTGINMELTSQVENYLNKISNLEDHLQTKNLQIDKLDKKTEEYADKITEIITKLQNIVSLLSDENKISSLNDGSLDSSVTVADKFKDLENIVIEVGSHVNTFKTNVLRNLGRQIISEMTLLGEKFNILDKAINNCFYNETKFSDLHDTLSKEREEFNKNNCLENVKDLLNDIITDNFLEVELKSLLIVTNSFCSNMKHKIESITSLYTTSVDFLIKKIETNTLEISKLNEEVNNLKTNLEFKSEEHLFTLEERNRDMKQRSEIINSIFHKVAEIAHMLHTENDVNTDLNNICDVEINTSSQILPILDKVASQCSLKMEQLEECSKQKEILIEAQNKIHSLTDEDIDLVEYITKVTKSNSDISTELQDIRKEHKNLIEDLKTSNKVLKDLKEELKAKSEELVVMESNVLKFKEQFNELGVIMKRQFDDLQEENIELRKKCLQCDSLQREDDETECNDSVMKENIHNAHKISVCDAPNTPPSLLTISCNKIVEIIQDIENNASSVTPSISKSDVDTEHFECNSCCECDKLKDELKILSHKNLELIKHQDELKLRNENLTKEIHDAYEEIKELLNCTNDLQKKIFNHKTNLSTLTATTYAENKSLSSQVKFFQLHHTRIHTVCQRDLPELQEQLRELMTLLKEENLESKLNASFKRYSLPVPLDSTSISYSFKNESTLDGDVLMLDTNVTVNTTADNTLTGLDQTCCEVAQACSYNDVACQTISCIINEQSSYELYKDQNIMNKVYTLQKENEDLTNVLKMIQRNKTDVVKVNTLTSPIKHISTLETPINAVCQICEKEKEKNIQLSQEIVTLEQNLLAISVQKDELEMKYKDLSLEVLVCKMCREETEQRIQLSQEIEKLKENLVQVTNEKDHFEKKYSDLSLEFLVCKECEYEKEQCMSFAQEVEKLKEKLVQVTNEKDNFEKKYSDLSLKVLECKTCEYEKEQRMDLAQEIEKLKESLVQVTNEKHDFEKKYNDLSLEVPVCRACEYEKEQHMNFAQEFEKFKEKLVQVTNEKDDFEKKYSDLSLKILECKTCEDEKGQRMNLTQEVEKLKDSLVQVTNEKDDFERKYSDIILETRVCKACEYEKEQRINLAQEIEELKESLVQVTNEKHDFEKKYSDHSQEVPICKACEYEKEQRMSFAQEVEILKEKLVQVTNEKDDIEEKYNDFSPEILVCKTCENGKEQRINLANEVDTLKENLLQMTKEKVYLEKKYNDLSLEVPSTEALLRKLHNFEKELENKSKEIEKLLTTLKSTKDILKGVQEENDSLSTQVMEFLTEIDDLKKDLEREKASSNQNIPISNSVSADSGLANINEDKLTKVCLECIQKDEHIKALESKNSNTHTRLSRSYSDSDSSSRYNKICTLQNELDAGREDCNVLKEEVTTIKNQLENNNLSISEAMDLDESIIGTNIADSSSNKSVMPKITEENISDLYNHDKLDCLNYYMEKLGEKVNYDKDVKIIDVMKTLYCKLMSGHENQIEIMLNKLRDYEHCKRETEEKIINITQSLEESNCNVKNFEKKLSVLRNNIGVFGENNFGDEAMKLFKENVLMVLDTEFSMNSKSIFETVLEQSVNSNELNELRNKYAQLEECSHKLKNELELVNTEVIQLKSRLSDKENEFNLLTAQKDRIHEINNALTMDLVRKEEEFVETVRDTYKKLAENNVLITEDIDNTLPPILKLQQLVNLLMAQNNSHILSKKDEEINVLKQDIVNYKNILEEKTKELSVLTDLFETAKDVHDEELQNKQDEIQTQKSLYDDLNKIYNTKIEESNVNRTLVQKLTEEINLLKENILTKDTLIQNLQVEISKYKQSSAESESTMPELLKQISDTREELDNLKLINQTLTKEKDAMAEQLEKSRNIIEQNKIEHNNMESEILILKESVKENDSIVEGLKGEIAALMVENSKKKEDIEEIGKELSRLQFNIKTHETTARIQTKMISRLQKQKEDDSNVMNEKDKQLTELNQKCEMHEKAATQMNDCIASLKQEVELLKHLKQSLEEKVALLESSQDGARKSRSSIESVTDLSRRRRQSIHDSTRMIDDNTEDHHKTESVTKGRPTTDESMDVDEDTSYRGTPIRLSKGRDSLQSKHEESEEDGGSRCSSAMAARRRRRSTHDLQRTLNASNGHDLSHGKLKDDSKHSPHIDTNVNSTVIELQNRLSACQQELEDLKESYKELDEECETCAEYLRERDEQCIRLKKEKAALEKIITDLNEKLQNNYTQSTTKASYADAAVCTDEDWTKLVVDRMSFDAEVEKNKKLRRAIEELRFNKQELKNIVTKMQKALEEKTSKDTKELAITRIELKSCREQLEDLKRKYQELDEECETCAQYLRERDEQCLRLKKTVVESEKIITDLNEKLHGQSSTKATQADAAVNTDQDFQSIVVDRMSFDAEIEKNKKLRCAIEELRFNNQEFKTTVAKIQKALEEKTSKYTQELAKTRRELESCMQELVDLKRKYQELDEECETCAQYLRERDEQCRKLKENVAALEAKVQEMQESGGHVSLSSRKKRQTLHDLHRPVAERVDASTEITEDFPSQQLSVPDDTQTKLIKKLKLAVEKLKQQNTNLEQQLMAAPTAPVFVATGSAIVQNQQITDVMRENQKLKKMNAELITLCKKRGKGMVKSNRENQDPTEEI